MSLKISKGNMYDWVTNMHSHLAGECPHKCSYCYVQKNRFGVSPRYQGVARLIEPEFNVNYGADKIIFIEHMNDMFAKEIPSLYITKILNHCNKYKGNQYIFQSKNPKRMLEHLALFPTNSLIGTTIETNCNLGESISKAPQPSERAENITKIAAEGFKTFITIEPALDFDVLPFTALIVKARPSFVNIGIDSKGCGLPEPSKEKILELIKMLQMNNIVIKKKVNLKRLGIDMQQ